GCPRGVAEPAAESLHAPWDLGVGHERGFFRVHVGREGGAELHPVEEQIAVLRRQYRRYGRAGRRILDKRGHGLALVRSKGGDIHEPRNLGIVSGFGDRGSSIGVADENCRPVLRCKNAPGNRHVVQRRRIRWRGAVTSPAATRPNERWSMDFVSDCVATGRVIRMLTIVDGCTRECPAIEVDTSLGGLRVRRVLDRIASERGLPEAIVLDNGPEFRSRALAAGAKNAECDWSLFNRESPYRTRT